LIREYGTNPITKSIKLDWLSIHWEECLTDEERAEVARLAERIHEIRRQRAEEWKSRMREELIWLTDDELELVKNTPFSHLPQEAQKTILRIINNFFRDDDIAKAEAQSCWFEYTTPTYLREIFEKIREAESKEANDVVALADEVAGEQANKTTNNVRYDGYYSDLSEPPDGFSFHLLPSYLQATVKNRLRKRLQSVPSEEFGEIVERLWWSVLNNDERRKVYRIAAQRTSESLDADDGETGGQDIEGSHETFANEEEPSFQTNGIDGLKSSSSQQRDCGSANVAQTSVDSRVRRPLKQRNKPKRRDWTVTEQAVLGKLDLKGQICHQPRPFRFEPFIAELALRHKYELECVIWMLFKGGFGDRTKLSYRKFFEEIQKLLWDELQTVFMVPQLSKSQKKNRLNYAKKRAKRIIKRGDGIFWKVDPDQDAVWLFGVPMVLASLGRLDGKIPFVTELLEMRQDDLNDIYDAIVCLPINSTISRHAIAKAVLISIAIQRLHSKPQSMFDFARRFRCSRASIYRAFKTVNEAFLPFRISVIRNYEVVAELDYEYGMFGYDECMTMPDFGELLAKAVEEGKVRCLWHEGERLLNSGFHFYKNLNGRRCLIRMLPNSYKLTLVPRVFSKVVLSAFWRRVKDAVKRVMMNEGWLDATGKITASAVAKMSATDRQWVLRAYNLGIVDFAWDAVHLMVGSIQATPNRTKQAGRQRFLRPHDRKQKAAVMGYKAAMRRRFGFAPPSLDSVVVSEPKRGKVVVWAEAGVHYIPYGRRIELLTNGSVADIIGELCTNSFEQYLPLSYIPFDFTQVRALSYNDGFSIARAIDAATLKPTLPIQTKGESRKSEFSDNEFRNALLCAARRLARSDRFEPVLSFSYDIQSVVQHPEKLELLTDSQVRSRLVPKADVPVSAGDLENCEFLFTHLDSVRNLDDNRIYRFSFNESYVKLESVNQGKCLVFK